MIVTLPGWGLGLIAVLCLCTLMLAIGLALLSPSDNIKAYAVQMLVVLVPLGSAVIAGIAIRRTSTQQIDRLVTGFLEKTLLERFHIRCDQVASSGVPSYPFKAVRLSVPCQRTSYVSYELQWFLPDGAQARPPVEVGFKCNVFNFEMFTTLVVPVGTDEAGAPKKSSVILNVKTIEQYLDHPVLKHLMGVLQGSVNEGYEVHVGFKPVPGSSHAWAMSVSLRQKLRENFLTSPFLKRYFAEDAAIAVGVLYSEWQAMQSSLGAIAPHSHG